MERDSQGKKGGRQNRRVRPSAGRETQATCLRGREGWQGKVKRQKDGGPVGWDIDSVTARSLLELWDSLRLLFTIVL